MSGATPGSWHAELAEAHAAINEMATVIIRQDAALRLALGVLDQHRYGDDGEGEEWNNDDVIAAIAYIESVVSGEPQRCDGCAHYRSDGACTLPHSGAGPMVVEYDGGGYELLVDAGHCCAAWSCR